MITIRKGKYKNITITIKSNGEVFVNAPKRTSEREVLNFIKQKQDWIDRNIDKIKLYKSLYNKFDFDKYVYKNLQKFEVSNNKEFYNKTFIEYITPLVKSISSKIGLNSSKIIKTNSKRMWGSMNNKKEMHLNWKLIILPEKLIEYVIVHELCHIKHLNHSKYFWQEVSKYLPDYKTRKKELKKYSFILTNLLL